MSKSSGRHDRSVLLLGEESHRKLEGSTAVLVGIGGVGSSLFEILVRQGLGKIIVIDPDPQIEIHNLDRQFLFRESDLGKAKALTAKKVAGEINPDVKVLAYRGSFADATNSRLARRMSIADLIISAVDNDLGRFSVAQFARRYAIPHLDGATGGMNCRAYIFPNPSGGPCYLCTMTRSDYEEISRRFSCTRPEDETPAPAITETGVQAANILATEALKLILGLQVEYNEVRVNLEDWTVTTARLDPTPSHGQGHLFL